MLGNRPSVIIGVAGIAFMTKRGESRVNRLDDVAVFVRVVEAASFTAAAEALALSQSAVSKAVSRLEDELGVRLLTRSTRRLTLTESGAVLYERAARALGELDEACLAVTALQQEPRGRLRVSAPMSFAILRLTGLVAEFLERYPGVTVDLRLDDRRVDLVAEGFDLALRIGDLNDSSLVARRLATCHQRALAAPAYLERHGTPRHPDELRHHNCLIYSYAETAKLWRFIGSDGEELTVPVRGNLEANNGLAGREAALAGLGVLLTPDFYVADAVRAGTLVPILEDWRLPERGIYALYPERRLLAPKVRAFVDFLAERMGTGRT